MNFGELKTAFFSKLPKDKVEEISVFEFGEAIDAAQRLFAAVLPKEVIPNILIEHFIDRRNEIGARDIFPLPEDYLRVEKVQFAQARDAQTSDPLRENARIVGPEEFEELVGSGSSEQIASVFNNLLHVSPTPVGAVTGAPAALRMIYRKVPRPYTTTAGVVQVAAKMHLRQDVDSRHTFHCIEFDTMSMQDFAHWGLKQEELPGGYAYIGAAWMTGAGVGPLYIGRIVMAWEEGGNGKIRISSDDAIPYEDEAPGVGFLFPYCYVTQRQIFGNSENAVEAEDYEFPDLGNQWHNMVVDYAVSRVEIKWNPKAAQYREGRVFQALSAVGAKLDYTKDDENETA